jgi:hypothetical protein
VLEAQAGEVAALQGSHLTFCFCSRQFPNMAASTVKQTFTCSRNTLLHVDHHEKSWRVCSLSSIHF